MNRIYRSIWNQSTGAYAAVSENVRSAGKRSLPGCSGGARFALKTLAAALMLGFGSLALAGPGGGTVVAGAANISGTPGNTVINQGSQNAVINWSTFNIGRGEAVTFHQPNSSAVALNRVLGSDATGILGNLSANGKVFIVNPNGILFGQGASVNTAGLVASTLDIGNGDFMAGKYQFNGNGSGKILNQGSISAPGGYVALLGANVSNQGTINARLGSVVLAAGKAITLDVAGDGLLNVTVNQGALQALVNNGGMLQAGGGQVVLTAQAAGDLLKTVVNNTGVIEAHSIDTRSGTIKLLGDMQSGTVNAAGTLDASAPDGGRGGFIDTSAAHVKIADTLKVTTAAAKGLAGTWLIDPADFNIAARGGDMTGAFLSNSLKSGNVQIQSISGSGGTQGNINVNDTIVWSANKLTLTAQNNININTAMRGSGTASLALEYGQSSAAGTGAAYNVKAEVDLPSGNNFSTRQGSSGTVISYKVINSLGAPGSVTANDLQGINGGLSGNYVLGSNIDATATSGWNGVAGFMPLGSDVSNFTGKFDGLGHVINNLKINRDDAHTGLFGVIGSAGSVSNLGLAGGNVASVAGGAYLGLGMLAGLNQGLVSNSYSSGSVTAGSYSEGGGLVGQNQGIINNSHSSAVVVHNDFSSVGGLVGHNLASAQINNSYASGTVTTVNGFAGGLVGLNQGAIRKSFATGAVSAGQFGGGLVAFNRDNSDGTLYGSVDQSYATGTVNAGINAGGLVGFNGYKASISNSYSSSMVTGSGVAGGIVGLNNQASISNSYATGKVSGSSQVGGVVGFNTTTGTLANVYSSGLVSGNSKVGGVAGENSGNSSVTNGYYNTTLNAALNGIGTGTGTTTGLSSTQMKTASNFAGFNFTTTGGTSGNNWVMVNTDGTFNSATGTGATLPMLSSEWSTTITSAHQLQLMGLNLTAQYVLANDINAANTASSTLDVWTGGTFIPVGTGSSASTATHFNGGLDGAFHVIKGLTINRPGQTYNGLFGTLGASGVVKSLGLEGGGIAAGADTGVLAGDSFGAISNVYSTVAVSGGQRTGGLIGAIFGGSVSDSYASGSVTGSSVIVGGLAGRNDGAIINSYASGAVSGIATTGGLAGTGAGTVSNSFWDSTTTGQNSSAGGLGIGLSTAQMKTLTNFNSATTANGLANPNWELGMTWVLYDGNSYPLLRGFMKQLAVKVGSASKTYDGLAYNGAGSAVYSNLADSDLQGTLVVGGNAAGAVNAGNYAISGSGLYSNSGQHGYSITYLDGALTVNQLAIALNNAAAGNKTYDGSTAAIVSGNLSGVLAGDIGNVTFSGTGSYADKNAGTGKAVTANATLGGSAGGNYTLAPISGLTGDIGKATISGVGGITAGNKVYDGGTAASLNTAGASFSGVIGSDNLTVLAGASGSFIDKNAANGKTVNISGIALGGADAGNYNLTSTTASTSADISKATIASVGGIVAGNKVYDGTLAASLNTAGASFSGRVGGDNLTVSAASGSFIDKNAANGKTVNISGIALGGADAGNYNLTASTASATADISKATITGVSGIAAVNKVYDGGTSASLNSAGASFNGMILNDELTVSAASGSFIDKNAANGKTVNISGIALGGADAGNYNLTSTTASSTADISKASIASVGGIVAGNKVYDGTLAASLNTAGASFAGRVGNDNLTVSNASGSFSDKNAGNGKTVNISGIVLGGSDAGNYNLSSDMAASSANISAKALTLTGLSGNKVYDGNVNATLAGGTLNGLVNSETLAFTVQGATFGDKNVGAGKAITVGGVTLGVGTGLASNYTLGTPSGVTGDITKATISGVSGLTAANKIYDGNLNTTLNLNSIVIDGKIAGDDVQFSGASGQFADKNVGTGKSVNITGITLGGSDLGNYNFISNTASATADITPKTVTLTGMTAGNKVYDGTTAAVLSGGTLSGVVSGETLSFSGGVGAFSDKNAGTGKLVTVSGAILQDGTGLASNYTFISPANLNADIGKATISNVSNVGINDKIYDGQTAATLSGAATFNGIVSGDSLTVGGSGAFSDKNAGNGKTVTVSGIVLGGADAGNYNLATTTAGASASITPKALTVSGTLAADKVYDGNSVAQISGGALNGLVAGETLGIAGQTAVFSDKNAASAKTVTVSGTTLVDSVNDLASNYTVSNPLGLSASITPKALTVTGTLVSNKVYDGNLVAQISGGTLNGLVASETLGIAGQTAVFSDKNAANAKTVTVSGITLVDSANGLASNYTVGYPTGLTASITRAVIGSVTGIVAGNKVYDGTTSATLNTSGATLAGKVAGDDLGVTGVGAAFSDKNAGNGKTVNLSGIALNGADAGNYVLASGNSSTSADITPATLTVSASGVNKVYDTSTAATVNLRDNRIGNDVFSIGSGGANFSDKNAGVGKTVTVNGIVISGADAGNYVVNTTASTTASIAQAALTVKVNDAEKNQGSVNPAFSASYNGLLGGDALASEVSGNLVFNTPATTGSAAGNYVVSATGQSSNNYALNYADGVLKVNPATSAPPTVSAPPAPVQSAVANVIAMATVAPSQGNMVPSEISIGDTPTAALTVAVPAEKVNPVPVVQLNGSVVTNLLPGLKLSVIDRGLLLPVEASATLGNGNGGGRD